MKYILSLAYFVVLAIPTTFIAFLSFASHALCSLNNGASECLVKIPITIDAILLILITILVPISVLKENRKYQKLLLLVYIILLVAPVAWVIISN